MMERNSKIVPFVGSVVSTRLWSNLLTYLCERVYDISKNAEIMNLINKGTYIDFLEAAELIFNYMGQHVFSGKVSQFLRDQRKITIDKDDPFYWIPLIGCGSCLTTNYDNVLIEAYKQHNIEITNIKYYDFDRHIKDIQEEKNVMFCIHGTVDEPERIILTRSQYKNNFGNPDDTDISNPIVECLSNWWGAKTFLFLGTSLSEPNITCAIKKNTYYSGYNFLIASEEYDSGNEFYKFDAVPIVYPINKNPDCKHESLVTILHQLARDVLKRYWNLERFWDQKKWHEETVQDSEIIMEKMSDFINSFDSFVKEEFSWEQRGTVLNIIKPYFKWPDWSICWINPSSPCFIGVLESNETNLKEEFVPLGNTLYIIDYIGDVKCLEYIEQIKKWHEEYKSMFVDGLNIRILIFNSTKEESLNYFNKLKEDLEKEKENESDQLLKRTNYAIDYINKAIVKQIWRNLVQELQKELEKPQIDFDKVESTKNNINMCYSIIYSVLTDTEIMNCDKLIEGIQILLQENQMELSS